jgi:hypothetical protein
MRPIAYLYFVAYFEPLVFTHESLESLCQSYVVPDVLLQTGNAVVTHHEPEFKRSESSAEWHSPVAVVYGRVRIAMLRNGRRNMASHRGTAVSLKFSISTDNVLVLHYKKQNYLALSPQTNYTD